MRKRNESERLDASCKLAREMYDLMRKADLTEEEVHAAVSVANSLYLWFSSESRQS